MRKIKESIEAHFDSLNLDLRLNGNGRYFDQKCTLDVLCSVSDVILEMHENGQQTFTVKNVMYSDELNEVMAGHFKKPAISDPGAAREYDKVASMPIKALTQAGVLQETGKSGNATLYRVANEDFLSYIAASERNTLNFVVSYLTKVMRDSGLYPKFEQFFASPNKVNYSDLKESYSSFIINYTKINGVTECNRIFPKVLNPIAFARSSHGSKDGHLSSGPIPYQDLIYNRPNFRDLNKPKDMPRATFLEQIPEETTTEVYHVNKAKKSVRRYHEGKSEVNRFKELEASHVHHIFPQAVFPELSDTLENLILLTPGQHLAYAHPNGNTQTVSKSYQLVGLLAKLDSIERSVFSQFDEFYSLNEFINVVNTGLDSDLLTEGMGVEEIRHKIAAAYIN
ncbi:MAG: hypothetical protein RPT12_16440 [Vibrio anguillarum]|uniref:hypothetical protein n=1 Tax=unclassified Vibrio TaxID=2614977 RepID=UPI002159141B|nr:hypothetical protein [Vibrio sp. V01_P9A10T6]MDT3848504.1 hypothetical protein [Vibrio anguillarum]